MKKCEAGHEAKVRECIDIRLVHHPTYHTYRPLLVWCHAHTTPIARLVAHTPSISFVVAHTPPIARMVAHTHTTPIARMVAHTHHLLLLWWHTHHPLLVWWWNMPTISISPYVCLVIFVQHTLLNASCSVPGGVRCVLQASAHRLHAAPCYPHITLSQTTETY